MEMSAGAVRCSAMLFSSICATTGSTSSRCEREPNRTIRAARPKAGREKPPASRGRTTGVRDVPAALSPWRSASRAPFCPAWDRASRKQSRSVGRAPRTSRGGPDRRRRRRGQTARGRGRPRVRRGAAAEETAPPRPPAALLQAFSRRVVHADAPLRFGGCGSVDLLVTTWDAVRACIRRSGQPRKNTTPGPPNVTKQICHRPNL